MAPINSALALTPQASSSAAARLALRVPNRQASLLTGRSQSRTLDLGSPAGLDQAARDAVTRYGAIGGSSGVTAEDRPGALGSESSLGGSLSAGSAQAALSPALSVPTQYGELRSAMDERFGAPPTEDLARYFGGQQMDRLRAGVGYGPGEAETAMQRGATGGSEYFGLPAVQAAQASASRGNQISGALRRELGLGSIDYSPYQAQYASLPNLDPNSQVAKLNERERWSPLKAAVETHLFYGGDPLEWARANFDYNSVMNPTQPALLVGEANPETLVQGIGRGVGNIYSRFMEQGGQGTIDQILAASGYGGGSASTLPTPPADSISASAALAPASAIQPKDQTGQASPNALGETGSRLGAIGGSMPAAERALSLGRVGVSSPTAQEMSLGVPSAVTTAGMPREKVDWNGPAMNAAKAGFVNSATETARTALKLGASTPEMLGYSAIGGMAGMLPWAAAYGLNQFAGQPIGALREKSARDALAKAEESGDVNARVSALANLTENKPSYGKGAIGQSLDLLGVTDFLDTTSSKIASALSPAPSPMEQAQTLADRIEANAVGSPDSARAALGRAEAYDRAMSLADQVETTKGPVTTDLSSPEVAQERMNAIAEIEALLGNAPELAGSAIPGILGLGGGQSYDVFGSGVHSFGGRDPGYSGNWNSILGYGGSAGLGAPANSANAGFW